MPATRHVYILAHESTQKTPHATPTTKIQTENPKRSSVPTETSNGCPRSRTASCTLNARPRPRADAGTCGRMRPSRGRNEQTAFQRGGPCRAAPVAINRSLVGHQISTLAYYTQKTHTPAPTPTHTRIRTCMHIHIQKDTTHTHTCSHTHTHKTYMPTNLHPSTKNILDPYTHTHIHKCTNTMNTSTMTSPGKSDAVSESESGFSCQCFGRASTAPTRSRLTLGTMVTGRPPIPAFQTFLFSDIHRYLRHLIIPDDEMFHSYHSYTASPTCQNVLFVFSCARFIQKTNKNV
jgi:hypothetical protein